MPFKTRLSPSHAPPSPSRPSTAPPSIKAGPFNPDNRSRKGPRPANAHDPLHHIPNNDNPGRIPVTRFCWCMCTRCWDAARKKCVCSACDCGSGSFIYF